MNYTRAGLFAGSIAFAVFACCSAAAASSETVLHSFGSGSDGSGPKASLLDVKGTLYGTTQLGGTYGAGVIFKIDPGTGAESVVHSFAGGDDAAFPNSSLINAKGVLYGATAGGGTGGYGTVYTFDPKTGAVKVLHSFLVNGSDGYAPWDNPIDVKKKLYGTTVDGGADDLGTVFEVDPGTGAETVLHSFGSTQDDGFQPQAALVDVKGSLYGTASGGGADYSGALFKIDPTSGTESVVYSFSDSDGDGYYPIASLLNLKGALYGTAAFGGANGDGAVFAFSPATGKETVLHSFGSGTDGQLPSAGLLNVKGTLYGTTQLGGTAGEGAVYEMAAGTGAESVVYSFQGGPGDGSWPVAAVINVKGALYGTASTGGANGDGIVFKITP
jgi:uncharacterized repeat protein (TIGR03803 family)